MVQYVWVSRLRQTEVSPRFDSPQEAGEWRQSSEGQQAIRQSNLFGINLRAISEGNWTRDATGAEKLVAGVI